MSLSKANEHRNAWFEGVQKCHLDETLYTVMDRIVRAEVHRLVIVDENEKVIGIVSLSDILLYLVLRPSGEGVGGTEQSVRASDNIINSSTNSPTSTQTESATATSTNADGGDGGVAVVITNDDDDVVKKESCDNSPKSIKSDTKTINNNEEDDNDDVVVTVTTNNNNNITNTTTTTTDTDVADLETEIGTESKEDDTLILKQEELPKEIMSASD